MQLAKNAQQAWQIILTFALFCVRLPVAIMAVGLAVFISWIFGWTAFRVTEYIYCNWLNHSW